MDDVDRHGGRRKAGVLTIVVAAVLAGCSVVPRDRLDESYRLAQTLRTENARLKDQVVALQAQNRDASDRALDDLRRLTARDQAIERLERSVEAYRDDRDRLAAAYERLTTTLGRTGDDGATRPTVTAHERASRGPAVVRADLAGEDGSEGTSSRDGSGAPGSRPGVATEGSGP